MNIRKIHKNNRSQMLWGRLILLLFSVCLFITGCGEEITVPTYDEEVEPAEEVELFAIVSSLDEVNEKITLRSVNYDTETELTFNGATDVKDKYGDIMSMKDIELGSVVEAVYDDNRDKLLSLYISDEASVSKVEEVSGAVIDYVENTVRLNGKTYPLSTSVAAFSDNTEIGLDEICSEDQLTVWMYNDKVCSFYVELGHGYVKLSDYASYVGGMIEIGYDVIVPVTEDMLLTVREGKYTLRIAKGDDVGTKNVEVIKNQEVNISLADIAIEPKQTGSVLFKVTPADAAVYIDGSRVNTEGAVKLTYGKHKINIVADGYVSYSASFNVNYAYKIKEYTLTKEDEDTSSTTATTESGSSTTSTSATTESSATTETTTESTTSSTTEDSSATENSTESSATKDSDVKDVSTTTGVKTSNKVIVSAPMGASVYFDGEYLGIAPLTFTKVTGSHVITFSQTGYLSKSYTVIFTDDGKDEKLVYDDLVLISSLIE